MPKIKKPAPSEVDKPSPDEPRNELPAREDAGYRVNGREGASDQPKPKIDRVQIALTEDGAADPGTREATISKLVAMIDRTPAIRARLLGGKGTAEGLIRPEQVQPFYSGIGMVNVFLSIRLLKLQPEIAGALIPYSVDELKMLSEATADAVNENLDKCPAWLLNLLRGGGSAAFAKLAMVLFQVHAQKLAAVKQAMAQDGGQRPQAVN